MRILIAEDDAWERRRLEDWLVGWGHEPVGVSDGSAAWKTLQEAEAPCLALLDWMMPRLEGPEVVRRVREAEGDDPLPRYLVLLSGRSGQDDVVRGFEQGADDYIRKPCEPGELRARIEVGVRMLSLRRNLADRVNELEAAQSSVDTLRCLIPICSYCKRIRNDQDYWTEVEAYLIRVSGAELSHGVCPQCFESRVRPDLEGLPSKGPA